MASNYESDMIQFLKGTFSPGTPVQPGTPGKIEAVSNVIRIDQYPPEGSWDLIPLFKIDISGNIISWQIGYDGISDLEIKVDPGDSIYTVKKIPLKSKEIADIFREARRYYKMKYREGYLPGGVLTPLPKKGMKGYKYTPNSIKVWPVYTHPKIDGIQMLSQDIGLSSNRRITMRSSSDHSFFNLSHIEQEIQEFFEYLPRYAILDGKLYIHGESLSVLKSILKTTKEIHPKLSQMEYWIVDINYQDPDGTPYEKRYELLVNAFHRYLEDLSPNNNPYDTSVLPKTFRIVPMSIAMSHMEIMAQMQTHLNNGFKGLTIRKISNGSSPETKTYKESLYHAKSCNHILELKP